MSNIKKHAVQETTTLHLRDASDELLFAEDSKGNPDKSKPMEVVLYGPGSVQYSKAQAASSNKMLDRLKKKGKVDQSADDKAAETAEFLAACTKTFNNVAYDDLQGESLARAIYADASLGFIVSQVNACLGDWSNFTKASTTK